MTYVTRIRLLLLLVVIALAAPAARRRRRRIPTGSRVGIVPPPGMTASHNFFGFEDREHSVAIIIVALPAEAFAEIAPTDDRREPCRSRA